MRLLLGGLLLALVSIAQGAMVAESLWRLEWGMNQPSAVALAPDGRAFVLDGLSRQVLVFGPEGERLLRFDALPAKSPPDHLPTDIAIDDERIYVADPGGQRIWQFSMEGEPLGPLLPKFEDKLTSPSALLVSNGRLFWADRAGHRLCRMRLNQESAEPAVHCWGERGSDPGQFWYPYMMAGDERGYLYGVDVLNARVQLFHPRGHWVTSLGRFGLGEGELYRPNGIALGEGERLYVSDAYRGTLSVFEQRRASGFLRRSNGEIWHFKQPVGLARWRDRLYVVDMEDNSLWVLRLVEGQAGVSPLPREAGQRPQLAQKECLICHYSWGRDQSPELPETEVLPVSTPRMCMSCHHGAVLESRHAMEQGHQHPSLHEDEKLKPRDEKGDEIPAEFPLSQDGRLHCGSCHTPHPREGQGKAQRVEYENPWLRQTGEESALCRQCHASYESSRSSPGEGKKAINHPVDIPLKAPPKEETEGYPKDTSLQQGLPEGLKKVGGRLGRDEMLVCQSCHRVHGAAEDKILLTVGEGNELCESCHERQAAEGKQEARKKGIHPVDLKLEEPLKFQGKEISQLTCGVCHSPHGAEAKTPLLPSGLDIDSLCRDCHKDQHAKGKEAAREKGIHPVDLDLEEPVTIKGREIRRLKCLSCHSVHEGAPNTAALVETNRDAVLCRNCHKNHFAEDKDAAREKGIHPAKHQLEEPVEMGDKEIQELSCGVCHAMHQGTPKTAALVESDQDAALCRNCHKNHFAEDREAAREKGIHPVKLELEEPVEINEKTVKVLNCWTCHAMHKGKPETAALVESDREGALCRHCHEDQQGVAKTDHDLGKQTLENKNLLDQPYAQAGLCGSCHSLHRGKGKSPFLFMGALPNTALEPQGQRDRLCLGCHQESSLAKEKAVELFDHPYKDLVMRSASEQMPLLGEQELVAEFGRIGCITCHDPHNWQPKGLAQEIENSEQENLEGDVHSSFLRRKGVGGSFCVSCHGLEAKTKYKYYHDEKGREKGLDYLR